MAEFHQLRSIISGPDRQTFTAKRDAVTPHLLILTCELAHLD